MLIPSEVAGRGAGIKRPLHNRAFRRSARFASASGCRRAPTPASRAERGHQGAEGRRYPYASRSRPPRMSVAHFSLQPINQPFRRLDERVLMRLQALTAKRTDIVVEWIHHTGLSSGQRFHDGKPAKWRICA